MLRSNTITLLGDSVNSGSMWQHGQKDTKSKGFTFWRQFDEKPSVVSGCPNASVTQSLHLCISYVGPT